MMKLRERVSHSSQVGVVGLGAKPRQNDSHQLIRLTQPPSRYVLAPQGNEKGEREREAKEGINTGR